MRRAEAWGSAPGMESRGLGFSPWRGEAWAETKSFAQSCPESADHPSLHLSQPCQSPLPGLPTQHLTQVNEPVGAHVAGTSRCRCEAAPLLPMHSAREADPSTSLGRMSPKPLQKHRKLQTHSLTHRERRRRKTDLECQGGGGRALCVCLREEAAGQAGLQSLGAGQVSTPQEEGVVCTKQGDERLEGRLSSKPTPQHGAEKAGKGR